MSNHLEFEQWVPVPLVDVFEFFSNPENLPRMMPAASATRILTLDRVRPTNLPPEVSAEKAAGVGSIIVTSFRVMPFLPIRAQWIARITEFEWNYYFADVQDRGPFKQWNHRHEFVAENRGDIAGTLVRDRIDYEVGFSFVGSIVNALFVRRQMERTFAKRQQRLPQLLGHKG